MNAPTRRTEVQSYPSANANVVVRVALGVNTNPPTVMYDALIVLFVALATVALFTVDGLTRVSD